MALRARSGTCGFLFFLELLMAFHALLVVRRLQLYDLAFVREFVTSVALLDFLSFFPNVLAVFVLVVTIRALKGFVFWVGKNYRGLLAFLENFLAFDDDVFFGHLSGSVRERESGYDRHAHNQRYEHSPSLLHDPASYSLRTACFGNAALVKIYYISIGFEWDQTFS